MKSLFRHAFALAIIATTFTASVHGKEITLELPPETSTFKPEPGVELAQTFCLQCHSVEYSSTQPPMPRKFWEGIVVKMRDKFGAPVPAEMDAKIVDYLVKAYGAPENVVK